MNGTNPPALGRLRSAWWALGAVVGAFLVITLSGLALRSPLGHDESAYGLRSRDLMSGWEHLSGGYWSDYRAPGLPLLLNAAGRIVGFHVTTARLVTVVLGVGILVLVWLIGREFGRPWAGIAAALVLTITSGFTLATTTLLADVPGAFFAFAATFIFFRDARRGVLGWSFAWVPLLAFAATLSRFGAPFTVAAGLLGAFVVTVPSIARQRNWILLCQSALLAIATAAVCGWIVLTDSFTLLGESPATANRDLVSGKGLTAATGWRDLRQVVNPWSDAYQPLWSKPVAVIFVLALLIAWIGAAIGRVSRPLVIFGTLSGVLSLMSIVATVGLIVSNYLVLSLPFWALVAGAGIEWVGRVALVSVRPVRVGACAVAGVLVLFTVADAVGDIRAGHKDYETAYAVIRSASVATGGELGETCLIVTSYTPQVGYYSECSVVPYWNSAGDVPLSVKLKTSLERMSLFDSSLLGRPDLALATLLVENGKRQPAPDEFAASPELFGPRLLEMGAAGDRIRHVWVDLIEPCAVAASCVAP